MRALGQVLSTKYVQSHLVKTDLMFFIGNHMILEESAVLLTAHVPTPALILHSAFCLKGPVLENWGWLQNGII